MSAEEARARKERSVALLAREGVPVNPFLPVIETADEIELPSAEAAALRAIALSVVTVKGEAGDEHDEVVTSMVEELRAAAEFTPEERAFVYARGASRFDRVRFTWRYEAYAVLLWALGHLDDLGRPDRITDVARDVGLLRDLGRDRFVAEARLRPKAEILDAADLIYRYHWATRDARLNGREPPAGLDPGVVQERHHALNWLILGEPWDEVATDT